MSRISYRRIRASGVVTGIAFVSVAFACGTSTRPGYAPAAVDGGADVDANPPTLPAVDTEQANGVCPTPPTKLLGTAEPGAPCGSVADCKPTCCGCQAQSVLAAACVDGKCVSAPAACALANAPTCIDERDAGADAGSGALSVASGALCVPGTADRCGQKWTGSSCCMEGPITCTTGNILDCLGTGKHWTGSMCCVDGLAKCGPGTADQCAYSDEYWTGTECCVANSPTCVPGNLLDCNGFGVHWTGTQCCVESPVKCVTGTADACMSGDEHWTGAQCCVTGAEVCVTGTALDCMGFGLHWTGTECCLDGAATTCAPGTPDVCTGTKKHWTGTQCCITNDKDGGVPMTCVAGTLLECMGPGEHWTGTLCCVE